MIEFIAQVIAQVLVASVIVGLAVWLFFIKPGLRDRRRCRQLEADLQLAHAEVTRLNQLQEDTVTSYSKAMHRTHESRQAEAKELAAAMKMRRQECEELKLEVSALNEQFREALAANEARNREHAEHLAAAQGENRDMITEKERLKQLWKTAEARVEKFDAVAERLGLDVLKLAEARIRQPVYPK